jgi:hypothetical protein
MMAAMSSADGPFGPGLRRGEGEDEAIDGSEIGRPLPGAITDEQLVLEQQGLGGDGADATGRTLHHRQYVQDCTARTDCLTLRIRHPHEADRTWATATAAA